MSRLLAVLLCCVAFVSFADDASSRLDAEQRALSAALLRACPKQKADIEQLGVKTTPAARADAFQKLDACGKTNEAFLIQYGSALNNAGRFSDAEAVFHRALALRVTESAQLGLLIALSRQPTLTDGQRREVANQHAYFEAHPCSRDDLCAALAYAAWHLEQLPLAKHAAERAMAMNSPGWQPWFVAGTIEAGGDDAARRRAVTLLTEAKQRGGPAKAIDGFLERLPK